MKAEVHVPLSPVLGFSVSAVPGSLEGGIKSNLVDDMAEAVNNADFVIVCFSTPYAQAGFPGRVPWTDIPI